jgi:hypothetical protein
MFRVLCTAKINFFSLGLLLLAPKVEGQTLFKKNWPCFELLGFVLGVLGMVENNFFCYWHPTFGFENRRLKAKKFAYAML